MNTSCSLVLKSYWSLFFLLPSTKLYPSPKASCFCTLIGCHVAACVLMEKNSALRVQTWCQPQAFSGAVLQLPIICLPRLHPTFSISMLDAFFRNLLRIKKYLSHNTHTQTHTHTCTHTHIPWLLTRVMIGTLISWSICHHLLITCEDHVLFSYPPH